MRINLSQEESLMLKEILINDLSDLRSEISHTDDTTFRENLKIRKHLVIKIIERLEGENVRKEA